MRRQFVIHAHSGQGELHYDLMLSKGDVLATWQLRESPVGIPVGESILASRLSDHRAAYLTYQGPVSGGRGEVAMLDRGSYELLSEQPARWEVRLDGTKISGRYELVREGGSEGAWTLRHLPDD